MYGADRLLSALQRSGIRMTGPRRAVVAAALRRRRPFTAQEIVASLGPRGVGRATVFRTLELLVRQGALSRMHAIEQGQRCVRYTPCAPVHHHHLRCASCDRVREVDASALERELGRVASRAGYHPVAHEVEIVGLCPSCR